jgi:tetratricopeptide (TPR) repeat protein
METLGELARHETERGRAGLLLQIPEQHQPDAGVRDLLLDALARLPDLVLAFTQDDNAPERDYADRTPLRLQLPILTAQHLPERIAAALGEHELPTPLLGAIAARAKGAAGEAAFVLADLTARGLLREGDDGRWRLQPDGDDDARLEELDRLLGPGLLAPLDAHLALVRGRIGSTAADDLTGFLHHAGLCGRNIPFGPIADVLGLDDPRRDRLLDLIDEHLVAPEPQGTDPAPPATLRYLAYRHPAFPDQELFRFRNPLLARQLRNRQGHTRRQARAEALLERLDAALPPRNRGVAELHLAVLAHAGQARRRDALAGELFYWVDAIHARAIRRQLTADLRARRVAPEVVWETLMRHWETWSIALRRAWLEAYRDQPNGVPAAMRGAFLIAWMTLLWQTGQLDEALTVGEEALRLGRETLGETNPELARRVDNVGKVLQDLGRLGEASARQEEALAIRRSALPAGHPDIATSLNNLGGVLHALGRRDEALARLEEALAILRAALPAGHPDIAASLNNLASALAGLGRWEDALARQEEALAIRRAALPAGHPDIATSLNGLGHMLHALGRREEALARLEEALAILRAALPAGHPDIGLSLHNLGWVYHQLGKEGEAARLLEESLAIFSAALPAGHPWIGVAEAALAEVRAAADSEL